MLSKESYNFSHVTNTKRRSSNEDPRKHNNAQSLTSSINGSFAIRKGDWKLIFAPSSGGWSYPRPIDIERENLNLPTMQLYNLKNDILKKTNIKNISVKKINDNKYRLLTGPFKNFNALKNTYISLNNLGFENLNVYKK